MVLASENQNARRPLPPGWRWVRLGEVIAEAKPGFVSGVRDPKGVAQVRMNNVDTRGRMVWSEFIRVPAQDSIRNEFQLAPGDVLFNNTNSVELVGKSALFSGFQEPVVYSNHFTRLRANLQRLDPQYLAAWLLQQWQLKVFENLCNRWIGQSAVKNDKLFGLEIPLPPLDEQRRIALILNDQMAVVERARAAAQAQLAAAQALPAAYLRAVFSSSEAQRWPLRRIGEWQSLGYILEVQDGNHGELHPRADEYVADGLPFIMANDIKNGRLDLTSCHHISPERAGKLRVGFAKGGDVLLSHKGSIGFVAIVPKSVGQIILTPQVTYYRPDETKLSPYFLSMALRSAPFQRQLHSIARQATRSYVGITSQVSLRLPFPSRVDQGRISAMLDEQLDSAESARKAIEEELDAINKLPAALLRRAFSGEL